MQKYRRILTRKIETPIISGFLLVVQLAAMICRLIDGIDCIVDDRATV